MTTPHLLAHQFVAAVIRLAGSGPADGKRALPVPSFGDVQAAVRAHFKLNEINRDALTEAIRRAATANRRDALDRALADLAAAHAQELVAGQQTAFLIGMEVGRATRHRTP